MTSSSSSSRDVKLKWCGGREGQELADGGLLAARRQGISSGGGSVSGFAGGCGGSRQGGVGLTDGGLTGAISRTLGVLTQQLDEWEAVEAEEQALGLDDQNHCDDDDDRDDVTNREEDGCEGDGYQQVMEDGIVDDSGGAEGLGVEQAGRVRDYYFDDEDDDDDLDDLSLLQMAVGDAAAAGSGGGGL
eukprot:gene1121-1456_t